jgi:two-component system CheB/CheR fusion protein
MQADGLMIALDEFAATTHELFKVPCQFECDSPVLVHDSDVAGHLYRIAQEAVGNSLKHGHPKNIQILLETQEDGTSLRIEDDGVGIPVPFPRRGGIGLQIMAHRAKVIGAIFDVQRRPGGGTVISCFLPKEI